MPSLDEVLATVRGTRTKSVNACHNDGCTNTACRNPQSLVLATAAGVNTGDKNAVAKVGVVVRYHLGVFAADRAAEKGTEVRPYHMCMACLTALVKVAKVNEEAEDHAAVLEMLDAAEARVTAARRERYPKAPEPAAPSGAVLPGRRRVAN